MNRGFVAQALVGSLGVVEPVAGAFPIWATRSSTGVAPFADVTLKVTVGGPDCGTSALWISIFHCWNGATDERSGSEPPPPPPPPPVPPFVLSFLELPHAAANTISAATAIDDHAARCCGLMS